MSIILPNIDFIKLEWWNSCDIDDILYQTDFKQRMFLKCDVGKPVYPVDEEGSNDGDGEFTPTFQKWQKQYSLTFLIYEYQMDAISLIPLHDNIWITLQNGESAKIKDIVINEPSWSECGCFATLKIDYLIDYKTSNCCQNMVLIGGAENEDVDPGPTAAIEFDFAHVDPTDFYFSVNGVAGKVLYIDWGDGNLQSHVMDGNLNDVYHTYITAPNVTISITGDLDNINRLNYKKLTDTSNIYIQRLSFPSLCTSIETIAIYNNEAFTLTIDNTLTQLLSLICRNCELTSLTTLDTFINLLYIDFHDNDLGAGEVNTALISVDDNNVSPGTSKNFYLDGGTSAAPTGAGVTAKTSLQGKGWNVFTN